MDNSEINIVPNTSIITRDHCQEPREESRPQTPVIIDPPSSSTPETSPAPAVQEETPKKSRPTVPPKPDFSRELRATSEPSETSAPVSAPAPGIILSGGEPVSLPPHLNTQTSSDSPMPGEISSTSGLNNNSVSSSELLSLKDRLKLFEKEIEDQNKDPEPKKDRKFSFLSADEVTKMKEEEAKRIASMTAMSMEAFESITSQISHDEEVLTQHIEALDKYDTSAPHVESTTEQEEKVEEPAADDNTNDDDESNMTEAEKRAAWRKARLQSLEEDAIQAQIVIDKMSELSTADTGYTDDNATYRHPVDTQGNITDENQDTLEKENDTDSEMTTSEDTTTGKYREDPNNHIHQY